LGRERGLCWKTEKGTVFFENLLENDSLDAFGIGKAVDDQGDFEPAFFVDSYPAGLHEKFLRKTGSASDFFYVCYFDAFLGDLSIYYRLVCDNEFGRWNFQEYPDYKKYDAKPVNKDEAAENQEPQGSCGHHLIFIFSYYDL